MRWTSELATGVRASLPAFTGTRVLMMPVRLEDLEGSLPADLQPWLPVVRAMRDATHCGDGVAYLTVDESFVPAGRAQRRPGLHVDGWPKDGTQIGGAWGGGGGGGWAGGGDGKGMVMVSSHVGCLAYPQAFDGEPAEFGDCEHLRSQCGPATVLQPGVLYGCTPLTVHESIPAAADQRRQFARLSMPSAAAWPASCTPNPRGIAPGGPQTAPRPEAFTRYGEL